MFHHSMCAFGLNDKGIGTYSIKTAFLFPILYFPFIFVGICMQNWLSLHY